VYESQKDSQSDTVLLLQFFHLHGLYTAPSGINGPALPPVIANATANEVATVRMLYDAFINGPLLGGHNDALEKLEKLATGTEDVALLDVTCKFISRPLS
jgi:hypothetical protein